MNQRLECYEHWRRTEAKNRLREIVYTWVQVGTARAAISAGSGNLNVQNELTRLDSTHTAVTWDDVRVGDCLREAGSNTGYVVTWAAYGGRRKMHQLYLKREDAPPGGD